MPERDTYGKRLKATLTRQEAKRLDALFQARDLVKEMGEAQRMLDKFVTDARKNGATWEEIGRACGISQQAAHRRWSDLVKGGESHRTPAVRKPNVPLRHEVQTKLAV